MPELQTFSEKNSNYIPTADLPENFNPKVDGGDLVIFTKAEFKHFTEEINKQFAESGNADFLKATQNARYLAELDRRIKSEKSEIHKLIEV